MITVDGHGVARIMSLTGMHRAAASCCTVSPASKARAHSAKYMKSLITALHPAAAAHQHQIKQQQKLQLQSTVGKPGGSSTTDTDHCCCQATLKTVGKTNTWDDMAHVHLRANLCLQGPSLTQPLLKTLCMHCLYCMAASILSHTQMSRCCRCFFPASCVCCSPQVCQMLLLLPCSAI